MLPSSLYGLEAGWVDDSHLSNLNHDITGKCNARAHLLPRNTRKETLLFETNILAAADKVTLAQARLAIRLKRDPNPIRHALLTELNGPNPPDKMKRAKRLL